MTALRAPLAGLALVLAPGLAAAQGAGTMTATLSQSAEADTNYNLDEDSPGTSYFGDTRFGLDILQETSTQRFTLGFDTGLRALWEAGQDFEFTVASPSTARAGYSQEWSDASLDADLSYRQRDVDFLDAFVLEDPVGPDPGDPVDPIDPIDPPIDPIDPIPDDLSQQPRDTTERRYDASVELALATDAPSSYEFGFQATRFDYDTDDVGGLAPRTTLEGDALWRLRLNPVLSGAVFGSYLYFDSEDDTETTVRVGEVDVGVIYEPREELSATFGVGYADRERRETIDGERQTTEDETGPALRVGLDYAVADEFTLAASARVTTAAPETRLSGGLRASYQLPRGQVTARLAQAYTGDSEGNEVRVTSAGIGLTRQINSVSSVGFDFAYGLQVNEDVEDAEDVNRADFAAIYSRSITENVFANLGYRFRWRDEEGSATSNAVFVTLGRSFTTSF